MKREQLATVKIPPEHYSWLLRRVEPLIRPTGFNHSGTEWDLTKLLASAYIQGCMDTLQAIEHRGVNLAPIDPSPAAPAEGR